MTWARASSSRCQWASQRSQPSLREHGRPQMLRHACFYKVANDGHDTRAIQHDLGHKNMMRTTRYTELAPDRFNGFWKA
jgi:site-specific recombinase XerD